MSNFKFNLGDNVQLSHSTENGVVIGRAEYSEQTPQYLVRYQAADGRQVENWWNEAAIAR